MKIKIRDQFGLTEVPEHVEIEIPDEASEMVPAKKPAYIHIESRIKDLFRWRNLLALGVTKGLWVHGDTQCGKSTQVEQFAAGLHQEVITVLCHNDMESSDLWGMNVIGADGSIVFRDGPALAAARRGAWLVLEEGDRLDPSTFGTLAQLMEGRSVLIPETNEVLSAHERFGLVVTANTRNGDDQVGRWAGAVVQNAAVMERFIAVEWEYPDAAIERSIVESVVSGLPEVVWSAMRKLTDLVRKAARGEDPDHALSVGISTGTLITWAGLITLKGGETSTGQAIVEALELALINRASVEDAEALRQLCRVTLG